MGRKSQRKVKPDDMHSWLNSLNYRGGSLNYRGDNFFSLKEKTLRVVTVYCERHGGVIRCSLGAIVVSS